MAEKMIYVVGGGTSSYKQTYMSTSPDFSKSILLPGLSSYTKDGCFTQDGKYLAVCMDSSPYFALFDTSDYTVVNTSVGVYGNAKVAASADNKYIAVASRHTPGFSVLDLNTMSEVPSTPSVSGDGTSCAFSPNSEMLAIGHTNGLSIIDVNSWTTIAGTPSLSSYASGVAFIGNGKLAVVTDVAPYFIVYDTETWVQDTGWPTFSSACRSIAVSPDGSLISIVANDDGYHVVIDASTKTIIDTGITFPSFRYNSAFSADGSLLAVVGDSSSPYQQIINTADWTEITGLFSTYRYRRWCAFSPLTNIPSREVITKTHSGDDLSVTIDLINRSNGSNVKSFQSSGDVTIEYIIGGRYWLAMRDSREGGKDIIEDISLNGDTGGLPPLIMSQSYIGDLVTISSNLTTQSGAAGDEVVIRDWNTRELVARVVPDANGDWSAEVPPGTYDVSYLAEGCAPVLHGPYTVELPTP